MCSPTETRGFFHASPLEDSSTSSVVSKQDELYQQPSSPRISLWKDMIIVLSQGTAPFCCISEFVIIGFPFPDSVVISRQSAPPRYKEMSKIAKPRAKRKMNYQTIQRRWKKEEEEREGARKPHLARTHRTYLGLSLPFLCEGLPCPKSGSQLP